MAHDQPYTSNLIHVEESALEGALHYSADHGASLGKEAVVASEYNLTSRK